MNSAAMSPLERLVERYLALHAEFRPVDASFMGLDGFDDRLPPTDPEVLERETAALVALEAELAALPEAESTPERLETRALRAQLRVLRRENLERPRVQNPTWFTGEAAFGLISLLLPSDPPRRAEDLRARLEALPAFLASGEVWLRDRAIPADWVTRARGECAALLALLERGLRLHEFWSASLEPGVARALIALQSFEAGLEAHPNANPASGEDDLAFLMREAHGLTHTPLEAETLALEGFQAAQQQLERLARQLDSSRDWRTQLADLETLHPASLAEVIPTYERLQETVLDRAGGLVTPARAYGLEFRALPAWAQEVAGALYFLFYRSPPAGRPGSGSLYWVFPPGADEAAYLRSQNYAAIKSTHVVHHGSIGHHTQNARARESAVRLGRVAGTDCASGIAMLLGGTTIEGWACYTQELMLEVAGFYSPLETLLTAHNELRNTAMCLADIRLHRGVWSLSEMRHFYVNEVGIPAGRVWSETTRNSMYPSTRLMYWLGTKQIREARARSALGTRDFHDALLQYGSLSVAWTLETLG